MDAIKIFGTSLSYVLLINGHISFLWKWETQFGQLLKSIFESENIIAALKDTIGGGNHCLGNTFIES